MMGMERGQTWLTCFLPEKQIRKMAHLVAISFIGVTASTNLVVIPFIGGVAAEKDRFCDGVEVVGVGNSADEVDDGLKDGATIQTSRIRLQEMVVETCHTCTVG